MKKINLLVIIIASVTFFSCKSNNTNFNDLGSPKLRYAGKKIIKAANKQNINLDFHFKISNKHELSREGFKITPDGNKIIIESLDTVGLMYGGLHVAEKMATGTRPCELQPHQENPANEFRAIKFNLPWSSYRVHESLQLHYDTCRSLHFWGEFLDMMAENRFNVLTLWAIHPWTYMVNSDKYPEANKFDDAEMAEWQKFWHSFLDMAENRGVRVFMVNWNIYTSPEFSKAHGVAEYSQNLANGYNGDGDYSILVQDYNKHIVSIVLEEYPKLAGIGVSQNERMKGVSEETWTNWIVDTYFDNIQQAGNKEFIMRGHTHPAPELTRAAIEHNTHRLPEKVWVPVKYNWSHGHASPELFFIHGGSDSDAWWEPMAEDYKIIFTIRNEDFFVLRWGQDTFIRQLLQKNDQLFVGGFIIGSETYIPAKEYTTKPGDHLTWQYGFEKQWFFYKLWGRLLYNPETPSEVFEHSFNARYKDTDVGKLFEMHQLSGKVPLFIATYWGSTWDFTLYSEGFLAGFRPWRGERYWDDASSFISVNELIHANPLDSNWLNISNYIASKKLSKEKFTPKQLADSLNHFCSKSLNIANSLSTDDPTLQHEIADQKAWAHLGMYFSYKLKGGIALQRYRYSNKPEFQQEAIKQLTNALNEWDRLIETMNPYFDEIPLVHLGDDFIKEKGYGFKDSLQTFSWNKLRPQVVHDIEIAKNNIEPEL